MLALAALVGRQHGVVSLVQLVSLGFTAGVVRKWVATGRLYRVHRGVYSLAPPKLLSRLGWFMAAVLAAGPGGVLSHRSAADLHGLRATERAQVEVTLPGSASRPRRAGIEFHSSRTLIPADITIVRDIPCTSIARTLLDFAAVVRGRVLERAFDQAEVLEVLDAGALEDQLARNPKHRGAGRLRRVLTEHRAGSTVTWSELEERVLKVCRGARLLAPEVNAWVVLDDGEPGMRVDFLWRKQRLIVEADGYRHHSGHRVFEVDRRRGQRLTLAGWRVIHVTWRQVHDEPGEIVRVISGLLRPR